MLQCDLRKLQNATIDFYNLTGLLIVLYDEKFNLVHCYPKKFSPFCAEIRRSPALTEFCMQCDLHGLNHCRETKELFIYQCHMGLTEAVAPIMDGGEIIGYLMLGQTLTEHNRESVKEQIDRLPDNSPADKSKMHKHLEEIVPVTRELLSSATRIMEMCACYLCAKNIVRSQQDTLQKNIRQYVRENLSSPTLSMREICHRFSISRSTLYAISKNAFGMGISDYIRTCRIEEAKKLLLKKEFPIYEVSRLCGFSAPNFFTKTFQQYVGILPKDFCKQNKLEEES